MRTRDLLVLLAAAMVWICPSVAFAQDEDEPEEELEVVDIPDTTAGKQLRWVLDVVNGKVQVGDRTARFADRFLEDFKPGELEGELAKIKPEAFNGNNAEVVRIDQDESAESITATIRGRGTRRYLSVFIALDAQNQKIASLLFNLAAGWDGDSTWDAFSGEMGEMKGSASFGAYEIIRRAPAGGELPYRLVPVHEFGEEKVLPIGSAFKLWVLGALAEEVAAGRVRWEDRMPIYESLRSLPTGVMQDQPGGTSHTIEQYARHMVSISDNTAADHLVARLGRERVEAFMSKVTDRPRLNQPLLSTRELFALKIGSDPELREDYLSLGADARRRMLAPGGRIFRARPQVLSTLLWTKPIAVDKLEWFASCHDLCRAMAALHELEQREDLAPVGRVLRENPGIPYNKEAWKSVGFKGGSEPGVMNLTFLLERADGRWFVMSTGWSSPTETLDESRLVELASKGFDLLEKHE